MDGVYKNDLGKQGSKSDWIIESNVHCIISLVSK